MPKLLATLRRPGRWPLVVTVICLGIVGFATLRLTRAATYAVTAEAETASLSGKASKVAQAGASGSVAVSFGEPTYVVGAIVGNGGKCLDIRNDERFNGNQVWLWRCSRNSAQQWSLRPDGTIRNTKNGADWCLDVAGASTAQRAKVGLWGCVANAAQKWTVQANGGLKNPASNLCLDAQWGASHDSTALWLWPCTSNAAQKWSVLDNPGPVVQPPVLRPLVGDPVRNFVAMPGYDSNCIGLNPKIDCDSLALVSINNVRASEGRPPMILPVNYDSLSYEQKHLAIVNAERADRGLAKFRNDAGLNGRALAGARANGHASGPSGFAWATNWAGNTATPLANNFEWMYDDGPGSSNIGSAWGHRHNILINYPAGAMGVGWANVGGRSSITQLFVKNY